MKLRILFSLLAVLFLVSQARAQQAPTRPKSGFYTTYEYLTYAILDQSAGPEPVAAQGVGGTLTLRPDGTYQKRLTLAANGTTLHFDQDGRFAFTADHITFTYTDSKGQPRTDEGTFMLRSGLLTLTMQGYPAGNQGIYTLRGH
ncbi:hypothetical protein [Hymenobacter guriensis]|uniref:Lipocalin-like domain-containing protein n=1 Tax=Hymenobacter guriensis TaxID=2793065 RepID=A0ABS0L741_9BACT|nr:hypothetical protein [Hymenobacter guriensis]MBG8555970.1 hypothetical protein [Hymenobacter guriensis]